jgi:hypothetical protein
MTTPTDGNVGDDNVGDETAAAEKVCTVMWDMLSAGREPTPAVTPAEVRRRADHTRHRRIDSKVVVALVAVAAVIAALIVVGPLRSASTPPHKPTPANPGSTTTTPPTTTTTTTIPQAATAALTTYVTDAERTDVAAADSSGAASRYGLNPFVADQSAPVVDDGHAVAVVAFSYDPGGHPVQVLQYSAGQWTPVAELAGPTGQGDNPPSVVFLTQDPIAAAEVTGDGRPDFLVMASAADNVPGFVVSQVGGTWHYVTFDGPDAPSGTEVIGRNPQFEGNTLVTDYNNCVPDCAGGTNTPVAWTYQPSLGEFTAPAITPSTTVASGQVAACLASALSASAAQGSGAGGHEAVIVVFTNTSSATCSLQGYPTTAWFEGPGGVHLPATVTQELASSPPATVTLAPGQKAATTVWTNNPAVFSASSCNPVTANAVTVGTSAQTSPLTEPIGITVCSTNNSIGTTPFTAGTAQSPM